MLRRSLAAILALACVPPVYADDEPHAQPVHRQRDKLDPRDALAQQLGDEAAAIDRALATVVDKLATADAARARRLAAAYRVLHAAPTSGDGMGAARALAAARLLVHHDLDERSLLGDEAGQLRAAAARTAADAKHVPEIVLPETIGRPAKGAIARRFGTVEHERSKTILSRRGIDIEVENRAPVSAPADGVVEYAGPIRGLDDGMVIDNGSYYTIIAKLHEPTVSVGTTVKRGDRIGRAARHRVYMELRVKLGPGGLPIDPEPLFEKPR